MYIRLRGEERRFLLGICLPGLPYFLSARKAREGLLIFNFDAAAGYLYESVGRHVLQHTGDDLAGSAEVAGDLIVRHGDGICLGSACFIRKEDGNALIHAHENQLLHHPHDVGEALYGGFEGEDLDGRDALGHFSEYTCIDAVAIAWNLGIDENIKGDALNDAGGREHADVSRLKAVERDLLAVLGENIHTQSALGEKEKTGAARVIMHGTGTLKMLGYGMLAKGRFILRCKVMPERKILFKAAFHENSPYSEVFSSADGTALPACLWKIKVVIRPMMPTLAHRRRTVFQPAPVMILPKRRLARAAAM